MCHELIGTGKSLKAASMCHFGDHQALCCSWQKINSLIFYRIILYHIASHHIVSFCIASHLIVLFRIIFYYNVSCCIAMYYTVSLWGICRLCLLLLHFIHSYVEAKKCVWPIRQVSPCRKYILQYNKNTFINFLYPLRCCTLGLHP